MVPCECTCPVSPITHNVGASSSKSNTCRGCNTSSGAFAGPRVILYRGHNGNRFRCTIWQPCGLSSSFISPSATRGCSGQHSPLPYLACSGLQNLHPRPRPRYPPPLLAGHLSFSPSFSKATLFLPRSKTDRFGSGVSIPLFARPSHLCPVSALAHFMSIRRPYNGPLFLFEDGTYLTRQHIVDILRAAFPTQPDLNTHSFRVGGASALAAAGVPDYIIQILGRWSSDSFLRYIHLRDETLEQYQAAMIAPSDE